MKLGGSKLNRAQKAKGRMGSFFVVPGQIRLPRTEGLNRVLIVIPVDLLTFEIRKKSFYEGLLIGRLDIAKFDKKSKFGGGLNKVFSCKLTATI